MGNAEVATLPLVNAMKRVTGRRVRSKMPQMYWALNPASDGTRIDEYRKPLQFDHPRRTADVRGEQ